VEFTWVRKRKARSSLIERELSARSFWPSRLSLFLAPFLLLNACSLTETRPVQDMSDTVSALRAAREVQADVLAPELYRQANEWFFKAKHEYRIKNFADARAYASKARRFAEQS